MGKRIMSLVLVCIMMFAVQFQGELVQVKATGTGQNYYVDGIEGNDEADGLTEATAWKSLDKVNDKVFMPGDKILLKSDSIWVGRLWPKGSGVEGQPISVDMYGDGEKPCIQANGEYDAAFKLHNQEYWEINNLELSNSSSTNKDLRGIYVTIEDFGVADHIYVKDCYIHDVNGSVKWKRDYGQNLCKRNGGIIFDVLKGTGVPTNFNDIQVLDNYLRDCSMIPIAIWQNEYWGWLNRDTAEDTDWLPNTNVVYRNNYVEKVNNNSQTCALLMYSVQNGLAEYNRVASSFTAGVECGNSDNILFQYNEVSNISVGAGGGDACAYDQDEQTTNTIMQYNYAHNSGVGLLIWGSRFGTEFDFRYNIIQNSWYKNIDFGKQGQDGTVRIYNNLSYVNNGKHVNASAQGELYNNIFYGNGSLNTDNKTYENNAYFNCKNVPNDPYKITEDPGLVDPGKGGGSSYGEGIPYESLMGYKLKPNSPLIDAGKNIADNGGLDFWGKVLKTDSTDIGPSQFDPDDEIPVVGQLYEAEDAIISGCQIKGDNEGYSGTGYVDYMNAEEDYIEWNVQVDEAMDYILKFNYANGSGDNRPLKLEVNDQLVVDNLSFEPTDDWMSWDTTYQQVSLVEGNNKIRLTANGNSGANIDYLQIESLIKTYEAEEATLVGVQVSSHNGGYSNAGYVDYKNMSDDYVEWEVNATTSGVYELTFRYANGGDSDRPLELSVNDEVIETSLSFDVTGSWSVWKDVMREADLQEGSNTIKLKAIGQSGGNIDYLKVTPK